MNKRKIIKMLNVLEFYANPDTYFAIGFLPDKPCGDFISDYDDKGFGKKARDLLLELNKNEL